MRSSNSCSTNSTTLPLSHSSLVGSMLCHATLTSAHPIFLSGMVHNRRFFGRWEGESFSVRRSSTCVLASLASCSYPVLAHQCEEQPTYHTDLLRADSPLLWCPSLALPCPDRDRTLLPRSCAFHQDLLGSHCTLPRVCTSPGVCCYFVWRYSDRERQR
jgi:hypothetical protein